jgi:hypothetical protein
MFRRLVDIATATKLNNTIFKFVGTEEGPMANLKPKNSQKGKGYERRNSVGSSRAFGIWG